MNTIAEQQEGKINNFTFLRLISASFVMSCHSWDLLNIKNPIGKYLGYLLVNNNLGVLCFFSISGFFITKSFVKNSPYYYLKSRVLRIFPGLFFSLLITAFILGGIATTQPFHDYAYSVEVRNYIINNSLLYHLQMNLPGVFENNPFPNAVNESLWTLPIEFKLYLVIFLVGITGAFKKKHIGPLFLLLGFIVVFYRELTDIQIHIMKLETVFSFMIGAFFYLFKEKIYLSYYLLLLLFFTFCMIPHDYKSL